MQLETLEAELAECPVEQRDGLVPVPGVDADECIEPAGIGSARLGNELEGVGIDLRCVDDGHHDAAIDPRLVQPLYAVRRLEPPAERRNVVDVQVSIDNHGPILTEIDDTLTALLHQLGASRVTLREDVPGDYAFPVTHEALTDGVASLREERTVDLRSQPVVRELTRGRQVVQANCREAFAEPAFHVMLETYGGLAAQIVTPVFSGDRLAAILSLHQLGDSPDLVEDEIAACTEAARRIGPLL